MTFTQSPGCSTTASISCPVRGDTKRSLYRSKMRCFDTRRASSFFHGARMAKLELRAGRDGLLDVAAGQHLVAEIRVADLVAALQPLTALAIVRHRAVHDRQRGRQRIARAAHEFQHR